jgi:glycosyltransferase involved in cell wall biosynthesis
VRASDVAAVVPCHEELPAPWLLDAIARRVGAVLVVGDGLPPSALESPTGLPRSRVDVLQLPRRSGKGTAVAAGIERLLARPAPPTAVLVVDGDGQHPPEAIPSFLAAATSSELVIGDRFADLSAMPLHRRIGNLVACGIVAAASGRRMRDTQCGMRLLRGRALHDVRFPRGGYEAETRHLRRCVAAGVTLAWVPIPSLYDGGPSSFRPVRDSLRVLGAIVLAGPGRVPGGGEASP